MCLVRSPADVRLPYPHPIGIRKGRVSYERSSRLGGLSPGADAVMASICGLGPQLWSKRILMNLLAFIDESVDSSTFCMAGYVSSVERWLEFSKEWKILLPWGSLNARGAYQFKMNEMASSDERMSHVPAFYRVIEKYVLFAVSVHFRLETISAAMQRIVVPGTTIDWAGWNNPYLLGLRALTDVINMRRSEIGPIIDATEKIDFVFDKRSEEQKVMWAWGRIQSALQPDKAALYGTVRFEDDEEFLPLQAADLWAWWVRKWSQEFGDNAVSHGRFPWQFDQLSPPKLSVTFDEDGLIEYLVDKLPQGTLPIGETREISPC